MNFTVGASSSFIIYSTEMSDVFFNFTYKKVKYQQVSVVPASSIVDCFILASPYCYILGAKMTILLEKKKPGGLSF